MKILAYLWSYFDVRLALVVFFVYFIVDGLYAYYTYSIVEKKPFIAATIRFVIHIFFAIGAVISVHNFLYAIPLSFGSWLGTYLIVFREKRKYRKE